MERVAGVGAVAVRGGDDGVPLGPAELPGQVTPDRVDVSAVILGDTGRAEVVAHDRDPIHRGAGVAVGGEKFLGFLRELAHGKPGGHVPQRQHRVSFAATEVGLKIDHRRGVVVTRETPYSAADQVAETLGEVGTLEELDRVGVVGVDLAAGGDLVEVGRELGGVEVAGGDIVVGLEHFAPWLEPNGLGVIDRGLEDLLVILVGGHPT